MNNKIYWIWLQNALKQGNHKVRTVNLLYDNIKDFYDAGEKEWRLCGCFTNTEIRYLTESSIQKAVGILDKSISRGYKVITFDDKEYPQKLKNIVNPPCVLYVKGDISDIDKKLCISIVGTRNATVYGIQMAHEIAYDLSKQDVIVISGGALGIDRAAHTGALKAGGQTIAVLGCGIDCKYLLENKELRDKISKSGALISEYPPDFPVFSSNFPIRNRIISGLSSGTVVIEAGAKSGSLITANLANDQNRDVFVVPVDMRSNKSQGTVELIRDGAKIVTCAQDILNEYNIKNKSVNSEFEKKRSANLAANQNRLSIKRSELPERKTDFSVNDNIINSLPKDCKDVYLFIKRNGKCHIDKISVNTNIQVKNLLSIITQLEICGFVESYPGKIYEAK